MVTRINKEALRDAIKYMDTDRVAKVGFFRSAKYENGTPVAYIAAIQEFGYKAIPPRSFIRSTISEEQKRWADLIGKGVRSAIFGKTKMSDVMERVAAKAAGDMRTKIADIRSPALAFSTLDARWRRGNGNDKPLVDTGTMITSLVHVVEAE